MPEEEGESLIHVAIEAETLVMYNKTSQTFRLVSEYFREEKIVLTNFIELGSMEAIKELVKIGLGVGITPMDFAREGNRRPDIAEEMERRWGLEFPVWMLTFKTRFRAGGALVTDTTSHRRTN